MISRDVQVWIDPVVYWCTELHSDGYYDALGHYIPPVTYHYRSEYHIDSLWYRDYTGSC